VNPLLLDFNTAPFSKITHKDFKPAIKEAIDISREEIEKITSNSAPPDFQNTTEALDFSGQKLGRITSILFNLNAAETSKDIQEVAKDISMQVAAMNPVALNEDGVSQDIIEKEIEIAKDQLRQEGKPEEMLDNIAKGKLKKFFKENTLVNQQFIKDSKQSISDYLKSQSENAEVTGFSRVGLV